MPVMFAWLLLFGSAVAMLGPGGETCASVLETPRNRFALSSGGSQESLSTCDSKYCRSTSCVHCAIKPGRRLASFLDLLGRRAGTDESVRLLTLGNSVARRNDFATSRTFFESLQKMFPLVRWASEVGEVEGGFEPEHIYNAIQARPWDFNKYDVVLVQYSSFAHKKKAEELTRLLLSMERRPLVILVQHCLQDSFEDGHGSEEGHDFWVKQEKVLFKLAHHYSLPVVSACNAFRTMLDEGRVKNVDQLFRELFDDEFHFTEEGSIMEGCLAADLIASATATKLYAPDQGRDFEELPAPLGLLDDWKCTFMNSTMNKQFWPNITAGSWAFKTGGKGGKKRWLQPTREDAALSFIAPPSNTISIEFYKHHEHAMGLVEIRVDGKVAAFLDACCSVPCVGIPGQGFYYTQEIAAGLAFTEHLVEIRTLKKNSTTCAELGNEFSLVGILGHTQPRKPTPREELELLKLRFKRWAHVK